MCLKEVELRAENMLTILDSITNINYGVYIYIYIQEETILYELAMSLKTLHLYNE